MAVGVAHLVRAAHHAFLRASAKRVLDDALDGARATATFGAAAKATVNLARGPRQIRSRLHGGADIIVGQHVAGADDHEDGGLVVMLTPLDRYAGSSMQKESGLFLAIPNSQTGPILALEPV